MPNRPSRSRGPAPVLLAPWRGPCLGVPAWDRIDPADFPAAFQTAMEDLRGRIRRIARNRQAPAFGNTILALERSGCLLDRVREGTNVWFALPTGPEGDLARDLIVRLPTDDPTLEADRRQAARVLAERAREASDSFRRQGADWDEMRALDLPAQAVEQALLTLIPDSDRLLDVGTGTGRVLELLAPRICQGLGVDASKAMLALARTRLSGEQFAHCAVRQADMYRLPLANAAFDTVVLQMVLHYAEDPPGVIAEAARVLRRGGRLIVIDLVAHNRTDLSGKLAHRWPGFSEPAMAQLLTDARLLPAEPLTVPGPLDVRLWPASA